MTITFEMMELIEREVNSLDDELIIVYNNTYKMLNKDHPNSFFECRIKKSTEKIIERGLKDKISNG